MTVESHRRLLDNVQFNKKLMVEINVISFQHLD